MNIVTISTENTQLSLLSANYHYYCENLSMLMSILNLKHYCNRPHRALDMTVDFFSAKTMREFEAKMITFGRYPLYKINSEYNQYNIYNICCRGYFKSV